jgi:uncharacterized protein
MLTQLNGKSVLITGASSGIGLEIAKLAAAQGAKTYLVVRDRTRTAQITAEVTGVHAPELLIANLSEATEIASILADLDTRGIIPDIVINNPGAGASGAFVEDDWSKLDAMLRVNMNALAQISHWAARRMVARGSGAIVNLSAAVATRPTPYFAAYAASKAFVTNLSIAMSKELTGTGVTVTAVHPPAVTTSFADANKADLRSTLVLKLFPATSALNVARLALKAALTGKRSVVVGPIAAIIMASAAIMPRSLDLAFMALLFRRESVAHPS